MIFSNLGNFMKRLPLDTSSFRQIRERDFLYVDKTSWIYRMIDEGICYFLSRPRRFGKSLTINTLKELFRGNRGLFRGLWIEDRWEFKEYPVLIFDFNGISHEDPSSLKQGLFLRLKNQIERYKIEIGESENLYDYFQRSIVSLGDRVEQKVVILIDEYDKPILDHLGQGEERLKIAYKNREILKSFFGVLKEGNIVDIIRFVFVTGVSRFTKVSIFSEWNNLQDISMEPEYADFLGYSEDEILRYFPDYLERLCKEKAFSMDECMERIRYWYNGYRFSVESDSHVYNPISLMYCLRYGEFKNYWFRTGTPTFLVSLLKEKGYHIPELEDIKVRSELFESYDLENLPVEAILYQSGYLTIKDATEGGEILFLSYPNQEVKISFNGVLFQSTYSATGDSFYFAKRLGDALKEERFDDVKEHINSIFSSLPYTLYTKADERFFHTIMYLALSMLGYDARSEVLSSRGRLDMAVIFKDKVYVLEFKVGKGAEDAISQIREKGYADRFRAEGKKVILCGISFDENKKEIQELKFLPYF